MNTVEGMEYDAETGDLLYEFWESQQEALRHAQDPDTDIAAFTGGNRSGKTIVGARWVISNALRHPGTHWVAMGVSHKAAVGSTYNTLFEQLPPGDVNTTESGGGPEASPIVKDHNRQKKRVTLVNESVIWLATATTGSSASYEGYELAGAWLDEFCFYEESQYDILETLTTRFSADEGPKTMLITSTGNGYNEAYDIISRQVDADGDPLGCNIEWVQADTRNNPFLDDDDAERMERGLSGDQAKQRLEGGFAQKEGLVYDDFSRATHVLDPDDARDAVEDNWRMYGYDAGWNDPRVVLEIGRTPSGQYVVLDEFYRSDTHVEDAIDWLDRRPTGRVYSEHEPSDIQKMKQAGITSTKAAKSIDPGIEDLRNRLELDDGEPGLLVSETCTNTIEEFLTYAEDDVARNGADDHSLDALRYAIHSDSNTSGISFTTVSTS